MRRPGWSVVVLLAASAGTLLTARRFLMYVTIIGDSMTPTLRPGDRVLILRRCARRSIRVGDVVVFWPPAQFEHFGEALGRRGEQVLVKRVTALPGQYAPDGQQVPAGRVYVRGDGPNSVDSRSFGPIAVDSVVGVVVTSVVRAPPR
jgi:signal peptidase I